MSSPESKPTFNPRLSHGGKLSFRRRVREPEDPGGLLRFGGEDPPPLSELVPAGCRRVEIEIGPGKGAFLLAATGVRPDAFVLGIEAAPAYASVAAARLVAAGRTNALLLVDNGKLYLQDRVPAGSVQTVHVYFPDPWPKRRHAGRRFFTDDVPAVLANALADGGLLLVATDNAAYAGQISRVLGSAAQFRRDEELEHRLVAAGPGHAFTPTNFERKYAAAGAAIRRYAFVRNPR